MNSHNGNSEIKSKPSVWVLLSAAGFTPGMVHFFMDYCDVFTMRGLAAKSEGELRAYGATKQLVAICRTRLGEYGLRLRDDQAL